MIQELSTLRERSPQEMMQALIEKNMGIMYQNAYAKVLGKKQTPLATLDDICTHCITTNDGLVKDASSINENGLVALCSGLAKSNSPELEEQLIQVMQFSAGRLNLSFEGVATVFESINSMNASQKQTLIKSLRTIAPQQFNMAMDLVKQKGGTPNSITEVIAAMREIAQQEKTTVQVKVTTTAKPTQTQPVQDSDNSMTK
jgi:hypothetical protein